MICTIYYDNSKCFLGWICSLRCTGPAQHLITADTGSTIDDLDGLDDLIISRW